MNRKKFERAVGDTTHAAADASKEALALAQEYLQQAQEYLTPRAQDAFHHAQERITPLARDARQRGARLAAEAMDAARPKIDEALDRVTPAVDHAYQRVAPAIDEARSKVQYGLIPWLADALHEAAEGASRVELPEVPAHVVPQKKKSVWATLGQLLLAGGLLAGVVLAVKKFLAPEDSGWQAHEPSSPYVPSTPQTVVDDLSTAASADAATAWIDDTPATAEGAEATAEADAGAPADEAPAGDREGDADPFVPSPYGEGSYVGANPPEGYAIKGNERSMKFHVPGNGGYDRTIADVWFDSETAAEAAGFTKAQR